MSTSTRGRYTSAAKNPKVSPGHVRRLPILLGSAAVLCLALGCAFTVYTNIFAASIYPRLDSAHFELPVIRQRQVAIDSWASSGSTEIAELPKRPPLRKSPATVSSLARLSFEERFAASEPQGVPSRSMADASPKADAPQPAQSARQGEPAKLAESAKPREATSRPAPLQLAATAPTSMPHSERAPEKGPAASIRDMAQRAKAAIMSIATADRLSISEKLWGKQPSHGSLLAYASADANITGSLGASSNPALAGSQPPYDRSTAVYDISAHKVYLPDGTTLEAHSGLGSKLDDPSSANIRMRGVTPPHLYELAPREALFHGVPALRLNPVGGDDAIYGRSGLLAHSFMLGPNGDSNGCVSFRDYNAFLNAYRNQGIKKLAVVAKIE